jgi:putative phage-type endonuclease
MAKYIELDQGTDEWLAWRSTHVTASDIPAIMGESPYTTPEGALKLKLGITKTYFNDAMRRGVELEPAILAEYSSRVGSLYLPGCYEHDADEWVAASMDGVSELLKHACEIKCVGESTHVHAQKGKVPPYYIGQMQWQMYVMDIPTMDYVSYCHVTDELIIVPVDRDDKYIANACSKAYLWWQALIQGKDKAVEALPAALRDVVPVTRDDKEWRQVCLEYIKASNAAAKLQELREKLISMSNGSDCVGSGVTLKRFTQKGRIRYSDIKELQDLDLDSHRGPETEAWRVTIDGN